jgi:hypothetical protein
MVSLHSCGAFVHSVLGQHTVKQSFKQSAGVAFTGAKQAQYHCKNCNSSTESVVMVCCYIEVLQPAHFPAVIGVLVLGRVGRL